MKLTGDVVPIETRYEGYRFRSRLEARWAVFFDGLRIEWYYEPEGYEMRNGERVDHYLPDFMLPRFNGGGAMYAEVKPFASEENWKKAISFADAMKCRMLLLDGPPDLRSYLMYTHPGERATMTFCERVLHEELVREGDEIEYLKPSTNHAKVIKAIHAARGARFYPAGSA